MNVLSLFDGMSCGQIALERAGINVDEYYASEIDKYAIQITKKNYPETIQLGDINNWREWNLPKIDLILAGSPCFVAGTKIICKDQYKNIEDVMVGDEVLTHKNNFQKVLNIGKEKSQTIIVKAQGIKPTETTENHPYYVRTMRWAWDKSHKKLLREFSNPEWKNAGDLKKGDFVSIPVFQHNENRYDLTHEDCWLIGRYIADGHIRKTKRKERKNSYQYQVVYSIGTHKLDEFKQNVSRHFSCCPHTKSVHRCVINSKDFLELLIKIGVGIGSINKKIPISLLFLPVPLLKSLLDGYMSGDGCVRKDGTLRASSISEELIMSLNLAIAKVYETNSSYEYTKKSKKHVIENRSVNQNHLYATTFRKEIGKGTSAIIIDNMAWLPVKEIVFTNNVETVYNIEVEHDNSYTANNAFVHNCQGFSIAGKGLNFDDPRSKLFFVFVDILEHFQPEYFLLENVKMKKEWQDIITEAVSVEPVEINSALVSAQNRRRLYWTNIPNVETPEDKGILLKDIIESGSVDKEKSYCIDANYYRGGSIKNYLEKKRRQIENNLSTDQMHQSEKRLQAKESIDAPIQIDTFFENNAQAGRVYAIDGKSVILNANGGGMGGKTGLYLVPEATKKGYVEIYPNEGVDLTFPNSKTRRGRRMKDKTNCLTAAKFDYNWFDGYTVRKLTPTECERLQTVPDNYTEGVSNTQRYKMLGNGWTVDVITHILKNIKGIK